MGWPHFYGAIPCPWVDPTPLPHSPGSSHGALPPLQAMGQQVELRRLPVGDFLWVARETDPPPGGRGFRWAGLPVGRVGRAMQWWVGLRTARRG